MSSQSFEARVRRMLPEARKLLETGGIHSDRIDLGEHVGASEPEHLSDTQLEQLTDYSDAHYVLGVAVGLLLNSSTFLKGGAR